MNRDRDFLFDMIELIETIERHRPESEEALTEDEVLMAAVIHWIQTIGEAANSVSDDTRQHHREVPWRQVVDMRNLLALDDGEEVDSHAVVDARFHAKVQFIVADDAGFNASVLEVHAFGAQKPDKIPADLSMSWRRRCGVGL